VDAVLVPGGFAYGDYLRTGAIARFSPVMQAVQRFAAAGGLVLGICNGFQILTEAGCCPARSCAMPGSSTICKQVHLRVEPRTALSPTTDQGCGAADSHRAHGGNYFCTPEELARLEAEDRVAFRYATAQGTSLRRPIQWLAEHIAGI